MHGTGLCCHRLRESFISNAKSSLKQLLVLTIPSESITSIESLRASGVNVKTSSVGLPVNTCSATQSPTDYPLVSYWNSLMPPILVSLKYVMKLATNLLR